MDLIYFDQKEIINIITLFGMVFCGGFTLSVALHYVAYAVFGVLALLNIKK